MDTHVSLDVLFFILALLMIPSYLPAGGATSPRPAQYLILPGQSDRSTPAGSPLPSPSTMLAVPSITLTPEPPARRPSHKRKSVSFSISSIDDLHGESHDVHVRRKRPPTPFVAVPISPAGRSPSSSIPGSAVQLSHSRSVVDPMGVEKSWLMS